MIVETGRHVKVSLGDFCFERTAETPGMVTLVAGGVTWEGRIELPANHEAVERLCEAYKRVAIEPVAYQTIEHEGND